MKSAVFYGKHDLRVEESAKPAVGRRDVLINVKACGVCGTDARVVDHVDVDGIRVDGGVVALDVKVIFEALLACEVEGLLDVLVIGVEAQDARDERTIGAVAAVGVGEGVPQAKGDFGDAAFQQAGGNLGAAQGAGGVR